MHQNTRTFAIALTVLSLLAGGAFAADAMTLSGSYAWSQGGQGGDLEAEFTPTGENTWDVSFHFSFRGKDHTYTGTARGSLEQGAMSGEVRNESGKRSWTFEGSFNDKGKFKGSHVETTGGGQTKTGTLTLKR